MKRLVLLLMVVLALLLLLSISNPVIQVAQINSELGLLAEINRIRAIDNHAHPKRVVSAGETDDEEEYAAPAEAFDVPVRLRPDNPEYALAWESLYSFRDTNQASAKGVLAVKQELMREHGDSFPVWALDQLGIEVMLSNRVAMGRGLTAPRFRWVPFADSLLFPLDNRGMGSINPDYRARYQGTDRLLKRNLKESGVKALPLTLDGYLREVVTATLARQKREGAIAVKFATAYHRSLDVADVPEATARGIYARFSKGGVPPTGEYKALQDFLFRYISREAGRMGLVVHVHVGGGASGYFNLSGANPFVLEPVLNDPRLRATKFVLIHGGLPFAQEARLLIYKPNVYADFSGQTFLLSKRELSTVLRSWLEFVPEKVLFATDAFEISPEVSWVDHAWLTTTTAREALAFALTGMMNDGDITPERALELAKMVMRDNAAKLYGLKLESTRDEPVQNRKR
jgi:uncharacterized protein